MIYEKILLNEESYMQTFIVEDPLFADGWTSQAKKRPIVVICPGGGYEKLSAREAEPIALAFNALGINAVVVYYRLKTQFPASLKDLSDAVCIVRDNAEKWNVDTNKVIVCGFSAGGHLAASLGVFWNSEPGIKRDDMKNRPNGMILAYPVITFGEKTHRPTVENITHGNNELAEHISLEKRVNSDTPPAFIWHTFEDELVPVENSIYMVLSLCEKNIPTEFHLFPKGPHGMALAIEYEAINENHISNKVHDWFNMAAEWIESL